MQDAFLALKFPELMARLTVCFLQDAFSALMFSELDFEDAPWPQLSVDAKEFVQHLLVKDPAKRLSALEALDHRCCTLPASCRPAQSYRQHTNS